MSPSSVRAVVAVLAPFALTACGASVPPAMAPAAGAATPPDSAQSTIVFVRRASGCDTGDYTVVVDEHGRFVANVAPGTQVAVMTAPGSNVFYGWSSRNVRFEKEANFNPVAATRIQTTGLQTKVVALRVILRESASNRCYPYAPVAMRQVPAGESDAELAGTERLVADQAAGQAELDKDPALLKAHLAFGARRVQTNEEARENPVRGDQGAAPPKTE